MHKAHPRSPSRLVAVDLDESSIGSHTLEVDHERAVAIYDLLEENSFELVEGPPGPYDGLLLIQPHTAIQVPGKLFEVSAHGMSASWLYVVRDSPAQRILQQAGVPLECIFPEDGPQQIEEKLLSFSLLYWMGVRQAIANGTRRQFRAT